MTEKLTDQQRVSKIQRKLLAWFEKHQRTFPWRQTKNPFLILVAEKLLQQTAATPAVIVAYRELASNYGTPAMLAAAPISHLRRIIAPLGLHYRAGEMKQLARTIVKKQQGKVPSDLKALLSLPGVGDYCARAVLCFAFGQTQAIVDTNVARFMHRVFGLRDPVGSNPARSRRLIQLASTMVPKGCAREFNLAVLDLCASVCTKVRPNCAACPLRRECTFAISSLGV